MKRSVSEIVVISGKGGTGKTSITASFAALAGKRAVLADCDVDAADLHLVLTPDIKEKHDFYSGREAIINAELCSGCGVCHELCRFNALTREIWQGKEVYKVDPIGCEGCGVCVRFCPEQAMEFPDRLCGEWMVSATRFGTMVHAALHTAAENSGRLVTTVRENAQRIAGQEGAGLVLTDGPPGIGCPVIASLTGAERTLIVTEPTLSGEHDLERVARLTRFFDIEVALCVNKWDINPALTERMEKKAEEFGVTLAGRVRYDRAVTQAQLQAKSVVELGGEAGRDIEAVWEKICE